MSPNIITIPYSNEISKKAFEVAIDSLKCSDNLYETQGFVVFLDNEYCIFWNDTLYDNPDEISKILIGG